MHISMMNRKMRSQSGYSLAELLMVLLIISLVGTVVVSGVNVCLTVYQKVVMRAEAQTVLSTAETLIRNEFCYSEGVSSDTTENPIFISGSSGACIKFIPSTDDEGIQIQYYASLDGDTFGSQGIQSLWNLQTKGSMGENYYTDFDKYAYDADTGCFMLEGLCVKSSTGDVVVKLDSSLVIRTINREDEVE